MRKTTTTTTIAKALVRAKNSGGISEGDLANLVNMLIDSAMALDVDSQSAADADAAASELLGSLATAIEDADVRTLKCDSCGADGAEEIPDMGFTRVVCQPCARRAHLI